MLSKEKTIIMALFAMISATGYTQIGIGTTTPALSSILDIESTTQGLLAPRMTTSQRTAIASPANGLMVFDTTVGALYHYDTITTSWIQLTGSKQQRLNYKLIKSTDVLATVLADEKTAGGNTKYLLDTETLYEINGTINLDLPIEMNNAYITGGDLVEDMLVKATGDLFTGATGGFIRMLSLQATSGNVFNLIGTGQTEVFIFKDCVVAGSASVGRIENFALVFLSFIQYVGNTNGIVYKNTTNLLLSDTGWFSTNLGTFEKLEGTFTSVIKQGGFSEVTGTRIGFDVSANPTVNEGILESVFTGTLTSGKYVNPYTVGTYTGFNFNNSWSVRSTGVANEGDSQATGLVYMDRAGTTQATTSIGTVNVGAKLIITDGQSSNLYRFTSAASNRFTYQGRKGRIFQVNAAISFDNVSGTGNTEYVFYFTRVLADGTTTNQLVATETLIDTNAGYIQAFPIQGSVYLNTGESVELWVKRINSNTQNFRVRSFSMSIK